MPEEREPSIGRRLYSTATLRQDWDKEAGEDAVSVAYWELFSDLLLVAAASAMADTFKEDQSWHGMYEFLLIYMAIINGWLLYTHHYMSRFHESSLGHTLVLFFYLLGMAVTIVNASYETAAAFSMGVIVQRAAWLAMLVPVATQVLRTKDFVVALGAVVVLTLLPHLVVACRGDWAIYGWSVAFLIDSSTEAILVRTLPGSKLVPINIEQTKDRLGVLVLVMLGETVISSTITYREFAEDEDTESRTYYIVLALSFLLIFMLCLLYFNVQPNPKDHGLRRSRFFGTSVLIINKWLGMTLLMIGVSIKLVVEAVAKDEAMSNFSNVLLTRAVGLSVILLLLSRLCHFGGRVPTPTAPTEVKWLMRLWWILFAVISLIPFFLPDLSHPIASLGCVSGLIFFFVLVESWFSHSLEDYLPGGKKAGSDEVSALTETNSVQGYASI